MDLSSSELKVLNRFRTSDIKKEGFPRVVTTVLFVASLVLVGCGFLLMLDIRAIAFTHDLSVIDVLRIPEIRHRGLSHHEVVILHRVLGIAHLSIVAFCLCVGIGVSYSIRRERQLLLRFMNRLVQLGEIGWAEGREEPKTLGEGGE